MSPFRKARKDGEASGAFGAAAASFSLIALIVSFAALFVATGDDSGGNGSAASVSVTLTEFAITPSTVSVPEGGSLLVTNNGTVEHDVAVNDTDLVTKRLKPGESDTLDLSSLQPGQYEITCTVSGHADVGMVATLQLGDSASGHVHGASAQTPEQLLAQNDASDKTMRDRTKAFPAETEGVGAQLMKPDEVLADGTKVFNLKAEVTKWEVEPGKTVDAWTYNGTVPGPTIKVDIGDKVRVVLDNQLPQSTAIHWHGIITPNAMDGVPDITQDAVKPGDKFTYEFVAQGPAVGMYHSHHHAEHQVPDGLAGTFLVGDLPLPADVPGVSQEIPMVLNDAGAIGFSLNGKSFPATAPIVAKQGEWVEIHYLNEGLQIHPMHLHGMPQLVIAKDGNPVPQPYLADTVTVAPGERYTVLVHATEPGTWAFHCHILNHAERDDGMFGMVTAFVVQ